MKVTDKRDKYLPDYQPQDKFDSDAWSANDLVGKDKDQAEREIINETVKSANYFFSSDSDNIETYRSDLNFLYADQWTQDLRAVRSQKKKTVLSFNYLKTYVDQLIGEEITNDPDVYVSYYGAHIDNNTQEEIDMREGLLKHVFFDNNFSLVKQTCFQYMLAGGFSVVEVGYDYDNPKTFNKRINIKATNDATMYFFDPLCKEPMKNDGRLCGKVVDMTEAEYSMTYPDAESFDSINLQYEPGDYNYKGWEGARIKLARVFKREDYKDTIVLLSNGESMTGDDAEKYLSEQDSLLRKLKKAEERGAVVPQQFKQKVSIIEKRDSVCSRIMHYMMNRTEILEKGVWPSQYLPYVYAPCFLVNIDGNLRTISLHRYAQDAQRYVNYLASEAADILMTSHHKNWMAPTQCFDGKLMNLLLSPQNTSPVLLYKRGPNGEQPSYVPPPQLSPDFNTQFQRATSDISNILGRFESNRGQDGNEKSGVAIDKRAVLGNVSSRIPMRNLQLVEEHIANICLDLMPAVYDTQRLVTVRGKDFKEKQVMVNQDYNDRKIFDMSHRGFKATIQSGISFEAQKQVSQAQLAQLMQTNPQLAPLLADQFAANLQTSNMPTIVDRIQEFQLGIPIPQIIAKETGRKVPPAPPMPPNPQAIAAQQKAQQAQMDFQSTQRQQQIDEQRLQLDAQDMVNEQINNHAKNVMEVEKLKNQLRAEAVKAHAEITKADLDNHADLVKHLTSQPMQKRE